MFKLTYLDIWHLCYKSDYVDNHVLQKTQHGGSLSRAMESGEREIGRK